MIDFPIIDTHVHLWDKNNEFRPPWLTDYPVLNKTFLLDDYDKATDNIDIGSVIFIECEVGPGKAMDEAKWIISLAENDKRIKGIVPWAAIASGDDVREIIEDLSSCNLVKGIRQLIQFVEDPEFCIKPGFIKGLQLLPEYNLSFDICISHDQFPNAIKMVESCPNTVFILDHIAKPDIKSGTLEPWKNNMKTFAGLDNVFCKMSGLITEADHENWKKEDLKPYIDHVIEFFGFERLIYGGDWPVVKMAGEYKEWFEALKWALTGCSKDELQKMFCINPVKIYKMD